MSLKAILDAIRAQGDAHVRAMEASAEETLAEILERARKEASANQAEIRREAIAPAYRERARMIHRARLEAMQLLGSAREELVNAALAQTRGRLMSIRSDSAYPGVLRAFLRGALEELEAFLPDSDSGAPILEADPRDVELLEQIQAEEGLTLEILPVLDCWGGLMARSEDGRIVAINTLESRFEQAAPYLRRYLAALFEAELPPEHVDNSDARLVMLES